MGIVNKTSLAISCDLWLGINSDFEKPVYKDNKSYIRYSRLVSWRRERKYRSGKQGKNKINNNNTIGNTSHLQCINHSSLCLMCNYSFFLS